MPETPSTMNDSPVVDIIDQPSTLDDSDVVSAPETAPDGVSAGQDDGPSSEDTFDRDYVEKLRAEAAEHRVKAKRAEEFAEEVFYGRVAALGKLADATDLPYDEALLEDRSALEAAVDELVARKPHLADRRPVGDVDQGARPQGQTVDLAGMLRSRAG
ncbi:hypothetical protein BH23ACT9_BH23ACT9_08730 [soil metagenome]